MSNLGVGVKTKKIAQLRPHPEAHRVPEIAGDQYASFLDDIRERGVRVPVELVPGTDVIIDGRSRWRAAKEAGIKEIPVIDAPMNGDDPVVYMMRAASKRRHLSDDQRACLAEEERLYLTSKLKQQRAKVAVNSRETKAGRKPILSDTPSDKIRSVPKHDSRLEVAKSHNVSERKVQQASTVRKKAPKIYQKVVTGQMRLAQAVREVEREEKRRELKEKAEQLAAAPPVETAWKIITDDCTLAMPELKRAGQRFRLIFADPPYNIGIDYGQGARADRQPDDEFVYWCGSWIRQATDLLTDDGSLWLLINDEYADYIGLELRKAGLHRRAWIKWYESFGVNTPGAFNRCSRHLFYCVKDRKRFVFNEDAVNRPSDRQIKYGDKRADAGGKNWDDVWGINPPIPRLVGTAQERVPDFPTQLPLALLRPIVGVASHPGDDVLDPFNGSATTGVAALELGRRYVGIEKSENFAELARVRLSSVQPARRTA